MARNTYEYTLKHWSDLKSNVAANPELEFLEAKRAQLEIEENGLREALDLQAAGKVQFHEATRAIEGHLARGKALAVQLHDHLRGHYGRSGEALGLFRLKPRRAAAVSASARKARRAEKTPSEPGANPAQTAAPETDGST